MGCSMREVTKDILIALATCAAAVGVVWCFPVDTSPRIHDLVCDYDDTAGLVCAAVPGVATKITISDDAKSMIVTLRRVTQ